MEGKIEFDKKWQKFVEWCGKSIKMICPECKGPCKVIMFFPETDSKKGSPTSIICVRCEISWSGELKFKRAVSCRSCPVSDKHIGIFSFRPP